MNSVIAYIKESFLEFKNHVTWASWTELQKNTLLVTVATIILTIFLFLADTGIKEALGGIYDLLT